MNQTYEQTHPELTFKDLEISIIDLSETAIIYKSAFSISFIDLYNFKFFGQSKDFLLCTNLLILIFRLNTIYLKISEAKFPEPIKIISNI